jgi:hypothetical protein
VIYLSRVFIVPWQISIVLAAEIFVVMRWIAPAMFSSHALRALGSGLYLFAPAAALIILVYAAVSYLIIRPSAKSYSQEIDQTS